MIDRLTPFSSVEAILGKPSYKRGQVLIYQGDSLELMHRLPAEIINLTITSPPYNIGKEYENIMHMDQYLNWSEQWCKAVHRITHPTGAFWLNLGYVSIPNRAKAAPLSYLLWPRIPFYLIQEIVWNYGAGVACKHMFSPRNEKFLWFVKNQSEYTFNLDAVRDPNVKYPNSKKNGRIRYNPLGKNPTDVWQIAKITSGMNRSSKERTPHPAQFPLAVIDRIVKSCSRDQDLVFDPFLGSGTVANAAVMSGRPVLGFELNAKYIEIAINRLDKAMDLRASTEAQQSLALNLCKEPLASSLQHRHQAVPVGP